MVSLVDTFDPPTIATSGRAGFASALRQRLDLARHQRAGAGHRCESRDAVRGRLGAVRRAERVVHVDVAQGRHLSRERLVVLLFALVEPAVLQHHDLAGRGRDVRAVDPVRDERHRYAEELGQAFRHRGERVGSA